MRTFRLNILANRFMLCRITLPTCTWFCTATIGGSMPMTWLWLSAMLFVMHGRLSLQGVRAFTGYYHSNSFVRTRFKTLARSQSLGRQVLRVQMSSVERAVGGGKNGNRLTQETSPYLLQHAYNPVDWMPWGDEAFRRAKEEDKPIFLSVGYSTCHW